MFYQKEEQSALQVFLRLESSSLWRRKTVPSYFTQKDTELGGEALFSAYHVDHLKRRVVSIMVNFMESVLEIDLLPEVTRNFHQ